MQVGEVDPGLRALHALREAGSGDLARSLAQEQLLLPAAAGIAERQVLMLHRGRR